MRARRGFSLLEVMVALAILVVSLAILVETQSNAVVMTREAERMITATDLAVGKLTEARLYLEEEGFQNDQVHEEGDFDDWGDDLLTVEIGDELEDYHWEWWITEVELELAGDIAGMVGGLAGDGDLGEGGLAGMLPPGLAGSLPENASSAAADAANAAGGLGSLLSPDMVTELLAPYVREVRVRVWWGDDSEEAAELGNEVVIVSHLTNPTGIVQQMQAEGLPR